MIDINARNQATKLRKTLIIMSVRTSSITSENYSVPLILNGEGVFHNENPVAVTRAVSEKLIWSFMTVEIPIC